MTLGMTRLHEWARKAKAVRDPRSDLEAAIHCKDSVDDLIDAYLDTVFIFSQFVTDCDTMFKKSRIERDKLILKPEYALDSVNLAEPVPNAVMSQFLVQHPGPHPVTDELAFTYGEREPYLTRGRGPTNNYEGPSIVLDFVLKSLPEGRPLLAQYKAAGETAPFSALVQLMAHSAMLSNQAQLDRLSASCPDAGFGAQAVLPMDLALIFTQNGRSKNRILNKNWDDSLENVRLIIARLLKSRQISLYIRQIHLIQATVTAGGITFAEYPRPA